MSKVISTEKYASFLLLGTILLLPLHTQLVYIILPNYIALPRGLFSMWKEILFLVVTTIIMLNFFVSSRIPQITHIDILMIFFVVLLIMLIFISKDMKLALYGFRVFVEPIAVYYLARTIKVNFNTVTKIVVYFYYLGVIISIWAILQAAILGDNFLIDIGYRSERARLHNSFYIGMFSFQRAAGTFASPNTYGIFIQMIIMIGLFLFYSKIIKNKTIMLITMPLLIVGLAYSFSRSSWIGILVSLMIFNLLRTNMIRSFKYSVKLLIIIGILYFAIFILNKEIIAPVYQHVQRTICLEDSSTAGHITSLKKGIKFISFNRLGVGLGMSGPRASAQRGVFLNSENSFFILAFDIGLVGLSFYCSLLFSLLTYFIIKCHKIRNEELRLFIVTVISIFVGQMVAWNFLPYIVELETTILLFFLLGIGHNLIRKKRVYLRDSNDLTT